jgi:hypothetical protein
MCYSEHALTAATPSPGTAVRTVGLSVEVAVVGSALAVVGTALGSAETCACSSGKKPTM